MISDLKKYQLKLSLKSLTQVKQNYVFSSNQNVFIFKFLYVLYSINNDHLNVR